MLTLNFVLFCLQIIQTVYFGLSVVNDIVGENVRPSHRQSKRGLQKFLDNFLASIVYPVGTVRHILHRAEKLI